MPPQALAEKRGLIGATALGCLATAAVLWVFADNPLQNQYLAAVTRVGIVLGALWLAWPAPGVSVAWTRAAPIVIAGALFAALNGRRLLYLLPLALLIGLAIAFLRPRFKRRRIR